MSQIETRQSRRRFLAGALRWTALAVVTAAGAAGLAKRRRLVKEGVCINRRLCQGCTVLADCELPAALAVRNAGRGGGDGRTK